MTIPEYDVPQHDELCTFDEEDQAETPVDECWVCELIARVRKDECKSIASVLSEYIDSLYKHVGDLTCQPFAGDTCDMAAAVRVAVNKVKGRIKK